jgi:putative serine protease PepD
MTDENGQPTPEEPARPEQAAETPPAEEPADTSGHQVPQAARSSDPEVTNPHPSTPQQAGPPAGPPPVDPPPASPWAAPSTPQSVPQPGYGAPSAPVSGQQGEPVLFGTAFAGHQAGPQTGPQPAYQPGQQSAAYPMGRPPGGPPTGPMGLPVPGAPDPRRRGHTALVAGMTVLALLVGGGAGAVGGYLAADNQSNAPVTNALDEKPPARHTSAAPQGSVEAVAEKVLPSVVQLQVRGQSSAGEGSGFVISSDGLIVTNNHVVEGAADGGQIVAVFHDGSTTPATIVGRDPTSDVAVVRAENKSGLTTVDLGRSDDLKVGESVVAIGSPFELSGTVTSGIVSSLHRPTRAGGEDGSQATVMDAIQTDAAINPGNSGGPLVNMAGQVIGINSAIYSPTGGGGESQGGSVGIGFAIPIDQARRTADEIVKTGKATQTILGVTVQDGPNGGARIVDVSPKGPGAKAGLKPGDVVTKLDDRLIDTSDALVAAVRSHQPGDKVKLQLSDGNRDVDATLAGQQVETG